MDSEKFTAALEAIKAGIIAHKYLAIAVETALALVVGYLLGRCA